MGFMFYLCGLVAVLTTILVIIHSNPMHALLYLILSLLSISGMFFSLGAYFAGVLEIIIYAGAVSVLFVFMVMTLNFGKFVEQKKRKLLLFRPSLWIGPSLVSLFLLILMSYAIMTTNDHGIDGSIIDAKKIGISLFGPYILIVELTSMLLLASLIVSFHIGRDYSHSERVSNCISNQSTFE